MFTLTLAINFSSGQVDEATKIRLFFTCLFWIEWPTEEAVDFLDTGGYSQTTRNVLHFVSGDQMSASGPSELSFMNFKRRQD